MARGITDSFSDGLARLLGEVGKLEAYPDADDDLISQVRGLIVQRVRQAMQPQMPPDLAGMMPQQEPMSRGPVPGIDTREMAAQLERQLSGQPPTG